MEWFFTRTDDGINGASTPSNRRSVLMGVTLTCQPHPQSHAAHPITDKKSNAGAVLIEWGPRIDSLRHARESISQNGWTRSSLPANNAGYQRLERGGRGRRGGGGVEK